MNMNDDDKDMGNITDLRGMAVLDREHDKIGTLEDIYLDEQSGQPAFATVDTGGIFDSKKKFIPMQMAHVEDDGLIVDVDEDKVKDAPSIDADEIINTDQERKLYENYGLNYEMREGGTEQQNSNGSDSRETVGRDTSGPTTDNAMTRSEEELQVHTERRETGKVRLKKYVVTEHVTTTVPVQREEVRIEREPITDENRDAATSGPNLSDEEHEITLTEEVPVVDKKVVSKERIRLDKDVVADQQQVEGDVRKEQIDLQGDTDKDLKNS